MNNIKVGQVLEIHGYKHNGKVHRSWDEARVLEITDEYIVCGNNHTKVIKSDGRNWNTKEPAILYFYKHRWFNVIGQLKEQGIYFYCNMASPYIIDDNTIKYIDYDLDLRVFPDSGFKILDKSEYKYHKKKMNYPESIDKIVHSELDSLINMLKMKEGPFKPGEIDKYYKIYKELLEKN